MLFLLGLIGVFALSALIVALTHYIARRRIERAERQIDEFEREHGELDGVSRIMMFMQKLDV